MAAWAVTWVRERPSPYHGISCPIQSLQLFIASTVLQGLLVLLLLYANLNLLLRASNRPTTSRPLDAAFIHAPIRLFLIMPLTLLLWQSLFISMSA